MAKHLGLLEKLLTGMGATLSNLCTFIIDLSKAIRKMWVHLLCMCTL